MMNTKLAAALLALTAACASENDGALTLSGQLSGSSIVTHVVAKNIVTGEHVVVDLLTDGETDGRFSIALPSGQGSWVVTFANAAKTGSAMRVATLQTAGIDAFSSKSGGAIDFGTVEISGRYAHGTVTWDRLESVMGASKAELEQRGALDNLALRYSNPDVDNDGELDAVAGDDFRLDIEGTYFMQTNGRDAQIGDLVVGLPGAGVRYAGTSIKAAVPSAMGMNMLTGTIQFEQPFFGTALGQDTPMIEAGTRIGQPHIKFGTLDGANLVGVVANGERNVPNGTYRFGFDNGQLTFTDVFTPNVVALASAHDYAMPFVRIRATDPNCTVDCDISSIDLEWKRATSFGWETAKAPSDAHIEIVAKLNGKTTNLAANLTDGATSQPWSSMPLAGTGLIRTDLPYIQSSEICYLAVSFNSELGMKMTGQVSNPNCF